METPAAVDEGAGKIGRGSIQPFWKGLSFTPNGPTTDDPPPSQPGAWFGRAGAHSHTRTHTIEGWGDMRAISFDRFGGPEVLRVADVAKPAPGPQEVLVRVHATSVNPVDCQVRRGDYPQSVSLPAITGHDVSGVVEAVGVAVRRFRPGEAVYYMPPIFAAPGSYAEYHLADERIVATKPQNLDDREAAAVPLVGTTVWGALVERAALRVGESILIHAGAGGVGSMAVQLARAIGATVLATCSPRNAEWVGSLGADHVIDYRGTDPVEAVREVTGGTGVDVVLDAVGGDALERAPFALKAGGRVVTIVDTPRPQSLLEAWNRNAAVHFFFVAPNVAALDALRGLLEGGRIRPLIDSVLPLEEAAAAHARLERGGVRGKVVLDVR